MVHNLLSINTYNTVGLRRISFFSEIRSPRSVTPFFSKRPLPPPKKMPPRRSPYRLVIGNDDVDCLAFFFLLVELASEHDDVGHVGHPCLIEIFGGISAFHCHDLAPVGLDMTENTFDGAVGVTKIFFIEFFDVLFFNAVDDALHAEVSDCLLHVKFLLTFLCFFLEGEYFEGG